MHYFVWSWILIGWLHAELPQPSLHTIFPAGAQQGQAVEVKITGTEVDDATLRFTTPGITAKRDERDKKKFSLTLAPDVKLGRCDVRVVNKLGISNPRIFEVSATAELLEAAKNNTRETAQELSIPSIINGTAGSQQDDWFKLTTKKGQRISLRCVAPELDSKMVPQLTLFDSSGHELINERRTARIDWTPPSDGVVTLRLNDLIYKGGPEFVYRLEVLPGKTETAITEPPNPSRAITLPTKIEAAFSRAHPKHEFTFSAKKGEIWWIDVTSERTGMKTNPRVVVQRLDKEKRIDVLELNDGPTVPGLPDYDGNHLDPTGKLEIKEDGNYVLRIRDLNNDAAPRSRHYQLDIRKPKPDFSLVAIPIPPVDNKPGKDFSGAVIKVWNHNIHRGEVTPVRLIIERTGGFDGEIKLSATGLPNGVTVAETSISGDTAETMLLLSASDQAAATIAPIKFIGTSGSLKHEARGTTTLWNMSVNEFIEPSRWRFTDEILLGVVEEPMVPVQIKVEPAHVESAPNGKVKLQLTALRRSDFKEALKLKPAGIARIEKAKDADIPASSDHLDYELDVEPLKLKPGTFSFWFRGEVKLKVNSKDATATLFAGPVVLTLKLRVDRKITLPESPKPKESDQNDQ